MTALGVARFEAAAIEEPVSDEELSLRYRTVPPDEHPRGVWLAPIKGIFFSPFERWANPFDESRFESLLEPGIQWTSRTDEDQSLMDDWFSFFEEGYPKSEKDSMIWADTLLSSTEPDFIDALEEIPWKLNAFILALSLRTRAPLRTQLLRFELEETPEKRPLPHSGYRPIETMHLRGWPGQQQLGRAELATVPETYATIWNILQQPIEHGMRRCLGAYRAAIGSVGFVDAIPVLSCAALEALAGTHKSGKVIQRLARYAAANDASARLEAFYRLRQWFAHGADVPEMRETEVRMSTVEDGLSLVKEIILAALRDPDLMAAASAGVKAVKAYLEP